MVFCGVFSTSCVLLGFDDGIQNYSDSRKNSIVLVLSGTFIPCSEKHQLTHIARLEGSSLCIKF